MRGPWRRRRRADRAIAPRAEDRIWSEVEHRIALGTPGRPVLTPVPDRRALVLAVTLVACALVAAGLMAGQRSGSADGVATATAGPEPVTWDELAAVAADQPLRRLSDTDVLTLTIDHLPTDQQRADGIVGYREELSLARDGRGQRRIDSLPEVPGTFDARISTFDDPDSLLVAGLTPAAIAALPADADALSVALRMAAETGASGPPTYLVMELLAVPVVPPPARAAAVRLLADLGAEVRGATTDARGRPGVAVVAPAPGGERIEAVIDPATTALLSVRRDDAQLTDIDLALALYLSVDILPDR